MSDHGRHEDHPAPRAPAFVRAWDWLTETQIWTSIFRHAAPINDRNRVLVMLSNVFLHLHPVRLRKSGVRLRLHLVHGGASASSCSCSLTFTGLLLMFYYRPTLEYAYADIVGLREHVPLGIMREMHRWGAHAMVITVWLHMFRVFMTGSYKPPREFNWNVGVIMLVLTLLLSFTGYLLTVGPAGDLGDHRGVQHGARDAVSWFTRGPVLR